jgi:2-polyprenyl-3-methyl-5-hydroxy-6-metoxy-1,4-benzoquinol methylase
MTSTDPVQNWQQPSFRSQAQLERVKRLETPFQIFRYMTGSEHLHFGLWDDANDPRPDAIARAQAAMTKLLSAHLPPAPARVIDVGCGIGGTAIDLAHKGYTVDALAPPVGLIRYANEEAAEQDVADKAKFFATGFLDVPLPGEPYDIGLSQESLQYIHPLKSTLEHFHACIKPGGWLIVGDQVLRALEGRGMVQFHVSAEIRELAGEAGFELAHHQDITDLAKPTVNNAVRYLERHTPKIVEFFAADQPNIAADLQVCIDNGKQEAAAYEHGQLGYELFVWKRA